MARKTKPKVPAETISPESLDRLRKRRSSGTEETLLAPAGSGDHHRHGDVGGLDTEHAADSADAGRAAAPDDEHLTPEYPGRYTLHGEMGRGGIGRVFLAVDHHLGREVAIKELHDRLTGERSGDSSGTPGLASGRRTTTAAETRFLHEARITGRLEHPGIVPVHELGVRDDGTLYYTMQVVRGQTLKAAIAAAPDLRGRLELLPNFLDLCHAVAYAHSQDVIHRDLKPDNVMLGEFGETVLLDWGLAKVRGTPDLRGRAVADVIEELRQSSSLETVAGAPIGTPAYMPPEQAEGDVDAIDERSDVYALGAVLYEILTGNPPHRGPSGIAVLHAVLTKEPARVVELEPLVPRDLAAIAERALAKDKGSRYASAAELAADIRRFQAGELVGAHHYSAWTLIARWARRRRYAILAVVGLVAVAVGFWWYRGYAEEQAKTKAEAARRAKVARRVEKLLAGIASGPRPKNWLDLYAYRLISLKEPLVIARLHRALGHRSPPVRRLAARALGGMHSKGSVTALCARLKEGVEQDDAVIIEVINALGVIGDPRAENPVRLARMRSGLHSYVWKNTDLAYGMIPLPPLVDGGRKLSAAAWLDRGRALGYRGRDEEALAAYSEAIKRDPKLHIAYNNRAIMKQNLGDLAGAREDYRRALKLDPKFLDARYNLSILSRFFGDYRGAIAHLDKLVPTKWRSDMVLRQRGRNRFILGDVAGAKADFREAARLKPKNGNTYWRLAEVLLAEGALEEAKRALAKAIAVRPRYVRAMRTRALVLELAGDLRAARAELDRALALDSEDLDAHWQRGRLRLALGDAPGARSDLRRAIAIPKHKRKPSRYWGLAIFYHAARAEFDQALRLLDPLVGAKTAFRALARFTRLYAIVAAIRAGKLARAREILRAAPRKASAKTFSQRMAGYLAGTVSLATLRSDGDRTPVRRLTIAFLQGVRAELEGQPDAARGHYREVLALRHPDEFESTWAAASLRALGEPAAPKKPAKP